MWWIGIFLLIVFLSILPAVPMAVCEFTGNTVDMNEADSIIAALPWFLFFTVPIGCVLGLLWIIRGIVYLVW